MARPLDWASRGTADGKLLGPGKFERHAAEIPGDFGLDDIASRGCVRCCLARPSNRCNRGGTSDKAKRFVSGARPALAKCMLRQRLQMAKISVPARPSSSQAPQPSDAKTSSKARSPGYETRKGWAGVGDRLQQLAEKFRPSVQGSPPPRVALNQRGLRRAAAAGDSAAVRLYAASGVDPNALSKRGDTALERALQAGSSRVVRELLFPPRPGAGASDIGRGANIPAADPNHLGTDGTRPLHSAIKAAMRGEEWAMEVIELLVKAPGIDLQAPDAAGRRPVDLLPPQPQMPRLYGAPADPRASRVRRLLATPSDALFHLNRHHATALRTAHAALPAFDGPEGAISAAMAHIEERLAQAPADRPVIICAGDTHGDVHGAEIAMRSMRLLAHREKGAAPWAKPILFTEYDALSDRAKSGGDPASSANQRQEFLKATDAFRTAGTDPIASLYPSQAGTVDNHPDELIRLSASTARVVVGLKANAAELGMSCASLEHLDYPTWQIKEARRGRHVSRMDYQIWSRREELANRQRGERERILSHVQNPEREDVQVANVDVFLNNGGAGCVILPGMVHLPYLREALADRCTFISVAPFSAKLLDGLADVERLSYCISHPDVFAFQSDLTTIDAGRFRKMMEGCGLDGGKTADSGKASSSARSSADSVSRGTSMAPAPGSSGG